MRSEGMSRFFTDTHFTLIGLIIFFVFFVVMVFYVFKKSRKKHYEDMSTLPLEDSTPNKKDEKKDK